MAARIEKVTCGSLLLFSSAMLGTLSGCETILGIESFSPADDGGVSREPATADGAPPEPPSSETGSRPGADPGSRDAAVDLIGDAGVARVPDAAVMDPDGGAIPAPDDAGRACAPQTTRCVGDAVAACGANGEWSAPTACAASESCLSGACAPFPSCAGSGAGLSRCGANGESCCTSLPVQAGMFHRSYVSSAGGRVTQLGAPATVSAFRLDKYLVTVGRFRKFVEAWNAGYRPPEGSGKHVHTGAGAGLRVMDGGHETGWVASYADSVSPTDANLSCDTRTNIWTPTPGAREDLPIKCVSWAEAYAFCIYDGGFLPSDAEWLYAAAGGNEQRQYPWGATPPGTENEYAIYACLYPSGPTTVIGVGTCNGMNLAPVGTAALGAGRWGQLDLAGALWEWQLDATPATGLPRGYAAPCEDCVSSTAGESRVLHGGHFEDAPTLLLPTAREVGRASGRFHGAGIRCARTP